MLPSAWQPGHDTTHQATFVVVVVVVRRWPGVAVRAPGSWPRHPGGDQSPAQVALQEPGHRLGVAAAQDPAEVVMDLEKAGRRRARRRLTHRADDVRTVDTTTTYRFTVVPPTLQRPVFHVNGS